MSVAVIPFEGDYRTIPSASQRIHHRSGLAMRVPGKGVVDLVNNRSARFRGNRSTRLSARKGKALVKVESHIVTLRDTKVILDSDLAAIYGITTSRVNEQVKRNRERFPEDFAFPLTGKESNLISQNAISRFGHGGRRKPFFVFTEHGALMAANTLKTKRAVQM